ncbi:tetratricopeptide repeat protein [Alteromonas sp. A081]|uniref:tetratricopeptide repeat protein n=1 Tax=Alteromonas sp. A081 TaxID=3410269 RepID=UPI003B983C62
MTKILTLAATLLFATTALAQTNNIYKLRTTLEDVYGVQEVENGNYSDGIRKLNAQLARTTVMTKQAPLHTNLCVAHIATGNLEAAQSHCEKAVNQSGNKSIALNNLAVLNCLQNKATLCVENFERSVAANKLNRFSSNNLTLASTRLQISKS